MNNEPWQAIFDKYKIHQHNFDKSPYILTAQSIKEATHHFTRTNQREVWVLCKQDTRADRPNVFVENGLFILPIKNGIYNIIKGEGYVDIPEVTSVAQIYSSKLDFKLETYLIGNSEMQHLDFAYASSLIRTFMQDDSLLLTIRGRKYTPMFEFYVGNQLICTESVQTEIDAGYEGRNQVALVEAKNAQTKNTIIRQLYYPFRQWQQHVSKKVNMLFFEKQKDFYSIWQFSFTNPMNYNSIELVKSAKFQIK